MAATQQQTRGVGNEGCCQFDGIAFLGQSQKWLHDSLGSSRNSMVLPQYEQYDIMSGFSPEIMSYRYHNTIFFIHPPTFFISPITEQQWQSGNCQQKVSHYRRRPSNPPRIHKLQYKLSTTHTLHCVGSLTVWLLGLLDSG